MSAPAEAKGLRPGGDRDHDGLTNGFEHFVLGTSPRKADTDGDGDSDYLEYFYDPSA